MARNRMARLTRLEVRNPWPTDGQDWHATAADRCRVMYRLHARLRGGGYVYPANALALLEAFVAETDYQQSPEIEARAEALLAEVRVLRMPGGPDADFGRAMEAVRQRRSAAMNRKARLQRLENPHGTPPGRARIGGRPVWAIAFTGGQPIGAFAGRGWTPWPAGMPVPDLRGVRVFDYELLKLL